MADMIFTDSTGIVMVHDNDKYIQHAIEIDKFDTRCSVSFGAKKTRKVWAFFWIPRGPKIHQSGACWCNASYSPVPVQP